MSRALTHRRGILDLTGRAAVMGVLNVTPDSFSDGGTFLALDRALAHAEQMLALGADVIDIGGESTRPGAIAVSEADEIARVVPVIQRLRAHSDALISIDTCKANVARAAVEAGADIVNDVTAGRDPNLFDVCAQTGAGLILMHTPVAPDKTATYVRYDDIVEEVAVHLSARAEAAMQRGIDRACIAIDPGFGFGKDVTQNFALAAGLSRLVALGYPLLVGVSRKRMVRGAIAEPMSRLHGDTQPLLDAASGALALTMVRDGARIVRAHDVATTAAMVALAAALHP